VQVFAARALSKYATITQIIVSTTIQLLKLLMIFLGQGIVWFAAIIILEMLLGALASLYFYVVTLGHNPLNWTWNRTYARTLTLVSLPLLFAGVSSYIFNRIDQVMLMHISDATSVGLYQSAVQVTELLGNLVPGIIIASVAPALINAKKGNEHEYFHRMRQLLIFVGGLSFVIVAGIYICSGLIVHILYGSAFMGAVSILHIYVWSSLIYMIMLILQQHLVNDNHTIVFFFLSASTALCNILLNLVLIPSYGATGAATASIISLLLYLILPLLYPKLRRDYARIFGFLP
jgi:O-antigen/teichoic acid export membrane protein